MQILNKANGVTLLSAGGGWFFRLEGEEVKFYVTQNEKWDGRMIAEHTFSREGLMVLGQAACPALEFRSEGLSKIIDSLPLLTPGEFIPLEETIESFDASCYLTEEPDFPFADEETVDKTGLKNSFANFPIAKKVGDKEEMTKNKKSKKDEK